jgi:hypothetical protein
MATRMSERISNSRSNELTVTGSSQSGMAARFCSDMFHFCFSYKSYA